MLRPAVLSFLAVLTGCSIVPSLIDDTAEPEPASYGRIIASNFTASFTDANTFSGFEISGLRRVFYTKGWSWLACLRFEADGHRRTYAFFIQKNVVIESRFAVQTDECGAQQYTSFDLHSGSTVTGVSRQEPLY